MKICLTIVNDEIWNENVSVVEKQIICYHSIIVYISKLLRRISNQTFYILSHIVLDNLITSFIISVVVCIIYCSNIIKILSILQFALHANLSIFLVFFVVFAFVCWCCESWRQCYSSDCEKLSSHSILFFVLSIFHYQFVKDFLSIYCTSNSEDFFS